MPPILSDAGALTGVTLAVPADSAGERVDRVIAALVPNLSRSQVQRLIKEGAVTIGGAAVKPNHTVRAGEKIALTLPEPSPAAPDAEALPLGNGLFDAVAMNFGILHLGHPEKALVEAHRVLRSGGRFAFSVWCNPKETIGFGIVLRAVETYGEPRVDLPEGPPFFRYSDPPECERGLIAAGFEAPTVTKVSQVWRLPPGDGLFNAMLDSTVRTAGLLRAQKPTVLNKIREAMRAEVEKYSKRDAVNLPMPALVASATKP